MEANLQIDVAALDDTSRRALEHVIGQHLESHQRLTISVSDPQPTGADSSRPAQSLDDWKKVYSGLTEREIMAIDKIANERANLTRDLP